MTLDDVVLVAPNAYPRHREFNLECAHVVSHYADELRDVDGGVILRIWLVASPEVQEDEFAELMRVAELTRTFDFEGYWSTSLRKRQELTLTFVEQGCLRVAARYGWDEAPFAGAGARVREADFVFGRFARRPKASPDRTRKAGIWFEVDEARAVVELRVVDRFGEVVDRHPVAETDPVEWWYVPYLGTVHWLDSSTIELRSKAMHPKTFEVR